MKKFVAVVCALALALAMPCMAFAADSPSNPTQTATATSSQGSSLTVTTNAPGDSFWVIATDTPASNTKTDENSVIVGSYESGIGTPAGTHNTSAEDAAAGSYYDLSFSVDTAYNGKTATVYIQYRDGSTDVKTAVVKNGTVYVRASNLGFYTIVIDKASAATNANASSTSPQTGVNFAGGVAGIAGLAIVAGGVALALRKKVTE